MTNPTEAPTERRSHSLPIIAGAVLAVALVAALLFLLTQNDDTSGAGSPTDGSASSDSTPSIDPSNEPIAEPTPVDVTAAAKTAAADGLGVLVPDSGAKGVVTDATYDPAAQLWQLSVETDAGTVVVRQHPDAAQALLDEYSAGAEQGDDVDLGAFQLGTWTSWTSDDGGVIATDLPGGGVTVSGPDVDAATVVAQTLLTFEYTGGGEQD